jgi:hypothetical protein
MLRKKFISHQENLKRLEAGAGIEPAIKALQAPALPLCYPAKAKQKEARQFRKRFQEYKALCFVKRTKAILLFKTPKFISKIDIS